MNEHSVVPFRIRCCSIYIQRHGSLHRNDMNASRALCTGGILQDGISVGKGVNMKVPFSEIKEIAL